MQAETALDSWRQWDRPLLSRPVILGALSGGRSNRSFLLDSDGLKMVLRINGPGAGLPDSSRGSEIRIWQKASTMGIAPPLLHIDEQSRYLVSTFISDDLPSKPQNDESIIQHTFDLLNGCHQMDIDAPSIDYAGHIEQYWQIIEAKGSLHDPALSKKREPMRALLQNIIDSNSQTAICHHDPVITNFVGSTEKLYLIDWEYAARGLPVMDYAALGVEWEIDDAVVGEQTGISIELLSMTRRLYGYMCTLWEEVT